MKKLILVGVLLFTSFTAQAKKAYLLLEFSAATDKQQWREWYLDSGGEDMSGYYVYDWSDNHFVMKNALELHPERDTKIKKEYCRE